MCMLSVPLCMNVLSYIYYCMFSGMAVDHLVQTINTIVHQTIIAFSRCVLREDVSHIYDQRTIHLNPSRGKSAVIGIRAPVICTSHCIQLDRAQSSVPHCTALNGIRALIHLLDIAPHSIQWGRDPVLRTPHMRFESSVHSDHIPTKGLKSPTTITHSMACKAHSPHHIEN